MNKSQAKKALLNQKNKLKSDEQWILQTGSIVESIFGRDSNEYGYMSRLTFRIPYTGQDKEEFITQLEVRLFEIRRFLDNCIEVVDVKGVYNPPTTNVLGKLSDTAIWTLIPLIGGSVFSAGYFFGDMRADTKNTEIRNELKAVRDSLSSIPVVIPSFPQPDPKPNTVAKNKIQKKK